MEGDAFDPKLMDEILKYNEKSSKPKPLMKAQGKTVKEPSEQEKLDMKDIDDLFKFVHNIPKIELHAHIGGCFRAGTFMELAD